MITEFASFGGCLSLLHAAGATRKKRMLATFIVVISLSSVLIRLLGRTRPDQ